MIIKNNTNILLKSELIELHDLIRGGFGHTEIISCNSFGLKSIKTVRRISKDLGLESLLLKNNRNYKIKMVSERARHKREYKIEGLLGKYSSIITDLVIDKNRTPNDLSEELKIPRKIIQHLINSLNLQKFCKDNSLYKLQETARRNGRRSSITLTGVELKPITSEISDRFLELKNSGMYKTEVYDHIKKEFGYKNRKIKQLCEKFGYPMENPQTGSLNPMYGKSPSNRSGIGVKCWIVGPNGKIFCRSSLELKIYCHLIFNNIDFEISKHRIRYNMDGVDRTYNPDIVIGKTVCEIKPKKLIEKTENKLKFEALEKYCVKFGLECDILTEDTFDLKPFDSMKYIDTLIGCGKITIDEKNLDKLKRYTEI